MAEIAPSKGFFNIEFFVIQNALAKSDDGRSVNEPIDPRETVPSCVRCSFSFNDTFQKT